MKTQLVNEEIARMQAAGIKRISPAAVSDALGGTVSRQYVYQVLKKKKIPVVKPVKSKTNKCVYCGEPVHVERSKKNRPYNKHRDCWHQSRANLTTVACAYPPCGKTFDRYTRLVKRHALSFCSRAHRDAAQRAGVWSRYSTKRFVAKSLRAKSGGKSIKSK